MDPCKLFILEVISILISFFLTLFSTKAPSNVTGTLPPELFENVTSTFGEMSLPFSSFIPIFIS